MKFFNKRNLASVAILLLGALPAMAEEVASGDHSGLKALGATLGLGIAAMGGAIGQGKAASAALEGIARNPAANNKIFIPMIIGLALIESLVIYALLIAFKV